MTPTKRRRSAIPADRARGAAVVPAAGPARLLSRLGILCGLVVVAIAYLAAPAIAKEVHVPAGSFGAGQLSLGEHSGIAVDRESGEVYVADTGNSRIAVFDAAGTLLRTFGTSSAPAYLAVDNSSGPSKGDVYVGAAAAGSVSKYEPDGTPISSWGTAGTIGGFPELQGIAVGPGGDLFVLDGSNFAEVSAYRYDETGAPVGPPFRAGEPGGQPLGLAVDTEGNLYRVTGGGNAFKVSPSGEGLGRPAGFGQEQAIATDPGSGDLYAVSAEGTHAVRRYAMNCGEACTAVEEFGEGETSQPSSVAIGPGGTVYVADSGPSTVSVFELENVEPPSVSIEPADDLTGTTAHLAGHVNPNAPVGNPSSYDVTWSLRVLPCDPGCVASVGGAIAADATDHLVEGTVNGLRPGVTYEAELVARNAGESASAGPISFTTPAEPPAIESQFATEVSLTSATLNAAVDPRGAATTVRFEYLPASAYAVSGFAGPELSISSSFEVPGDAIEATRALAAVANLIPGTPYVYRAVAENEAGATLGDPASFSTQGESGPPEAGCPNALLRSTYSLRLPDCRAYEQVSPVDKNGAAVEAWTGLSFVAPDGSAATYFNQSATTIPASGGSTQSYSNYLGRTDGSAWGSQRLSAPQEFGEKTNFLGLTPDFRYAFVEASRLGEGPGTGRTMLMVDTRSGGVTQIVSWERNQLDAPYYKRASGIYALDGTSEDGSRVFFETRASLTDDAAPGRINLYVWDRDSAAVSLVGILPGGSDESPAGGSFGGAYNWYARNNTGLGGAASGMAVAGLHAISPTGSQVFFTAGDTGQLYLRRGLGGSSPSTVHVSKPNTGVVDPNGPRPAAFQEATPDGSRAFFLSAEKLTEDAKTGPASEGRDLYRWDSASDALVDVTPGGPGENGAEVLGLIGVDEDGSAGYFVARGELAPGASSGSPNLYRFEEASSENFEFKYIATLANESGLTIDGRNWSPMNYLSTESDVPSGEVGTGEFVAKTARVTPDAKTLLFTSVAPLTGYDNLNRPGAGSECENDRCAQLFRFDSEDESLVCVSCNPSGERPFGSSSLQGKALGSALALPETYAPVINLANLSSDGNRVFFESPDALVAADANGVAGCPNANEATKSGPACTDVYQWEAAGTPGGSCTKPNDTGGCLSLISNGQSDQMSRFIGASTDGSVAFFATSSRLVPTDRDASYDLYSARVNGGLASQQLSPATPCNGESCQTDLPASPQAAIPGSQSFSGPGNASNAKKHHRKKHHRKKKHGKRRASQGKQSHGKHKGGSR